MKLRLVFYPNPPPGIVPLLQADAIRISFPEPLVSSPRFSFTPRRQFQDLFSYELVFYVNPPWVVGPLFLINAVRISLPKS